MSPDTVFSFATASPAQIMAFIGSVVVHLGFFAWVVYLVRMRPHGRP